MNLSILLITDNSYHCISASSKKYDKDIKTYLYYLEEDEPKKEILITDEELEEDFKNINKTTQDILDNKFPKIPYNHNICGICEFKNYCWGLE